jgi:hypothetical protein
MFLLPLAVLVLWMEAGLAGIPNSYSFKKKNLEKKLPDIELLIVGSSHAYFDIDPAWFRGNAYNMANASQSLYYDAKIIEKYLPEMKRLKKVLFAVTYFSFGFHLADSREDWRCFYYERYYGIPPGEKGGTGFLDLRKYSLTALYGGKESFKYMLKGFKVNLAEHVQPNGWYASTIPMGPINAEAGRKRVLSYNADMQMENYDRNYQRLDELFRLLRQKGIEPVIITPPVYRTCRDNLDPARVRKMEELIHSLCSRYKAHYFNYLADNRFILADFSDNDHLNPQGAEKFTRILNEEIPESQAASPVFADRTAGNRQ